MTQKVPLAAALLAALASCGTVTGGTIAVGGSATLTDAEAILAALEARRATPTPLETDASDIVAGLQAVLAASTGPAGRAQGGREATAIAGAEAALRAIAADVPDPTVQEADRAALAALAAVTAGRGTTDAAETEIAALLLDALATESATKTLAHEASR